MYEVVDIVWTELKMREKYTMPMVPNKRDFLSDFYHAMGSFFGQLKAVYSGREKTSRQLVLTRFQTFMA